MCKLVTTLGRLVPTLDNVEDETTHAPATPSLGTFLISYHRVLVIAKT